MCLARGRGSPRGRVMRRFADLSFPRSPTHRNPRPVGTVFLMTSVATVTTVTMTTMTITPSWPRWRTLGFAGSDSLWVVASATARTRSAARRPRRCRARSSTLSILSRGARCPTGRRCPWAPCIPIWPGARRSPTCWCAREHTRARIPRRPPVLCLRHGPASHRGTACRSRASRRTRRVSASAGLGPCSRRSMRRWRAAPVAGRVRGAVARRAAGGSRLGGGVGDRAPHL